ncbi:MAG: hypothetical protein K2K73_00465, partial [Ureaplasma sp.]|nr:hypothetical protein [Ureaplasma sp.]
MRIVNKINNMKQNLELNKWNIDKVSFKKFLKNSIIFINFALFNGLLPIFICLILSCVKPMGTQYTMAIGYITAIQLGFVQLSWSITIAIFYAFYKESGKYYLKDKTEFFATFFMVTLLYSLVATVIFFGSSYIYNYYASMHLNTLFGRQQAFYYLYIVWIYIFINSFIYSFIIFIQLY